MPLSTTRKLPLFFLAAFTVLLLSTGTAKAAGQLTLDPTSFNFGAKNIGGEASFPGEFTITNTGDQDVTVGRSGINPGTNFLIPPTWDSCWDVILAPGQSCPVDVMFEPEEEGTVTAELQINSSAPGAGPTAALSGLAYPRLLPSAGLTPANADFGKQGIGLKTATKVFELTNGGLGDLEIGSASISGEQASEFTIESDRCQGRQTASGMTCEIEVSFTPGAAGIRRARLTVPTSDEDNRTVSARFSGTGLGFVPEPRPDGTASIQVGRKIPPINKGKLKVPIVCETKSMDLCEGRIKVFAQGGKKKIARGTFAVPEGKWSATLYPRPKLLRLLKRNSQVKATFEVRTLQESGKSTTLSINRSIRQR